MGRQNTIRIDYGGNPNRPTMPKVQNFCAEKLGLKRGEVIRIQNSHALGVTFVTVVDLDLALKVCEEHGNGHAFTGSDKKQYPVTISIEDGTVLVKLLDLSTDVSNEDIAKFLEQYGEVRDVYEEQLGDDQEFAGAYTGVRLAKMVVRENIASWVSIKGEQTKLSYYGQRNTCRHCHDFLHVGVGCSQNKKLLVQKTYADSVKETPRNSNPKPQNPKPKPQNNKPKPQEEAPKPKGDGKNPGGPVLPEKPAGEGDKTKGPSSEMLPPAEPLPSGSGLSGKHTLEKTLAGGEPWSKPRGGKGDGNETDTSTSSRRSDRNKNKKKKYNEDDIEVDDEQGDGEEEL